MDDPYFSPQYVKANAIVEGGTPTRFRHECGAGVVDHQFIVRPIKQSGGVLHDLTTPYGYGGPVLRVNESADLSRLVRSFEEAFSVYCQENRVVSEFIRFHPFELSATELRDVYNVKKLRTTVGTDLTGGDVLTREFSKGARKKIRRNERLGVEASNVDKGAAIGDFKRLYAKTMDRNTASGFYYFGDDYFETLLLTMPDNVEIFQATVDNVVVASAFCLVNSSRIHIHLSGTDTDYLSYSPAYNVRAAIAEWGLAEGKSVIHHGGGRTDAADDSLFRYKEQFGSLRLEFHIGQRIWDEAAYADLCRTELAEGSTTFFPGYRAR